MMGNDNLRDTLRTLTSSTPREAPERVEVALRSAFRKQQRSRSLQRRTAAVLIATAACIVVTFSFWKPLVFETTVTEPPAPIIARQLPPAAAWIASRPEPEPAPRRHRMVAAAASARPHGRPVMLEFVLLPYGDPSLVDESAAVVRVELPRSALQLAGFTVPQDAASDRVQADVLLGADGLAHAVRFVGFQR